ncbi:MAG TPA: hypothetical protein VKJ07_12040, partial [Mycobacteriales bacterium]|nr:hypothetical protein [Mycobacteriales bacterium]
GTWSGVTVVPSAPTTVVLQRSATAKSAPITVFPVSAPTAVAPAKGYAERSFTVAGNAGAPVSVQLWTQPAGTSSYSLVKTVTAASSGAYSVTGALPAATSVSSTAWKVVSTAGSTTFGSATGSISVQPLFAPTSTGTSIGYYRGVVTVTGTAVPGDAVTLWTKPATSGSWTRVSSVTADAATGAYSRAFTLVRDTVWRVTSPTGTSAARTTVVRPSLHVPSRAKPRTVVYISGTALPGQKVAIYRRSLGTAKWNYFTTVTAASTGRWTSHFRFTHAVNVLAGSRGHYSPGATIRVA